METFSQRIQQLKTQAPYSLGKLIEWKPPEGNPSMVTLVAPPYSLGKLIEWKL